MKSMRDKSILIGYALIGLFIIGIVQTSVSAIPDIPDTPKIYYGYVTNKQGSPLSGVCVKITAGGNSRTDITESNGYYRIIIDVIPYQPWLLATKSGYSEYQEGLSQTGGRYDFKMSALPQQTNFEEYKWKYIPIIYFTLYDPAGTDSYQEITETWEIGTSFTVEAEPGEGTPGIGGSTSASADIEFEQSIRTVDEPGDNNGIGLGDVICGKELRFQMKLYGYDTYYPDTGETVRTITGTDISDIDINYDGSFYVSPDEFYYLYGYYPESKVGETSEFFSDHTVGEDISVTRSMKVKLETSVTLSAQGGVTVFGYKYTIKAEATLSAGYALGTTIFFKDEYELIKHRIYYNNPFEISGNEILASSLIAWFDTIPIEPAIPEPGPPTLPS